MNESYLFEGLVYPERAQISLDWGMRFMHVQSGKEAKAQISIILNKIVVWIDADDEWNILDLRNVVKNIVQTELAIFGFFKGFAYDFEITRGLNRKLGVDLVFGVDIPCIVDRNKDINLETKILALKPKLLGTEGILVSRCLNDLVSAMKSPDDTGFYCYRAIESLRQHCILKNNLNPKNKSEQWKKLKEIANCSEDAVDPIKTAADPVRHGEVAKLSSDDRAKLFLQTWDIVEGYLQNC